MLEDLHFELILTGVEQHVTQETFQRFQDIYCNQGSGPVRW